MKMAGIWSKFPRLNHNLHHTLFMTCIYFTGHNTHNEIRVTPAQGIVDYQLISTCLLPYDTYSYIYAQSHTLSLITWLAK